jgi:hypothetical protein
MYSLYRGGGDPAAVPNKPNSIIVFCLDHIRFFMTAGGINPMVKISGTLTRLVRCAPDFSKSCPRQRRYFT